MIKREREREWVTRLRRMREERERVVGFAAVVCIACMDGGVRSEEGCKAEGAPPSVGVGA